MSVSIQDDSLAAASIHILLVEDLASDRKLIERALRKGGIRNVIHHACDGQEALDYLLGRGDYADRIKHPLPGLVLLDLKLPKVSGLEVLKHVKGVESLKRIPIVVLTSSEENRDVDRAYEFGANSYLVKPVKFSAFCEVAAQIKLYWLLLNKGPDLERSGG